mgnify:CR=1 FL=1
MFEIENRFLEGNVGISAFARAYPSPNEIELVAIINGIEHSWVVPEGSYFEIYLGGTGPKPVWEKSPYAKGKNFYTVIPAGQWFGLRIVKPEIKEEKPPEEMKVLFGYVRDHDTKVGIPDAKVILKDRFGNCLLYTSPSPRDRG